MTIRFSDAGHILGSALVIQRLRFMGINLPAVWWEIIGEALLPTVMPLVWSGEAIEALVSAA